MRGLLIIIYTIISWYFTGLMVISFHMLGCLGLRSTTDDLNKFIMGTSMSNVSFLIHHILRVPMYQYGDEIDYEGTNVFIMNHRSSLDFLFFISFICQTNDPSKISIALKSILKYVPGMGWVVYINDFPLLNRSLKDDGKYLETMGDDGESKTILIFPEGTRFSPPKLKKSNEYSLKNNYPQFNNVLLPKTKGTHRVMCGLLNNNNIKGFYDLTINLKGIEKGKAHRTSDLIFKDDIKSVHIHVKKINICSIPRNEDAFRGWLHDLYKSKDLLLELNLENWPKVFTKRKIRNIKNSIWFNTYLLFSIASLILLFKCKSYRKFNIIILIIGTLLVFNNSKYKSKMRHVKQF
ncbi:Acyltransferase [seawater metagenome]|uniref:Acyltransferase n=1 Tax=seawater metagenome TaxID=1561972 RepID=A0A5E8CGM1_9ZZZZ